MNVAEMLELASQPVRWNGHAEGSIPRLQVAMCTMNRIEYLPWTIACLESQTESSLRLAIWNNNSSERDRLEELLDRMKPSFPVTLIHSRSNVGGVGRFLLANCGCLDSERPVVFIDDDQFLVSSCLASLLGSWRERALVGWWAWKFLPTGGYRDRTRVCAGEAAHYLGTGGLILPREVLSDPRLIEELPEQYVSVEDLWLSYFAAKVLGYHLIASENVVVAISDGRNQHHRLTEKKMAFLTLLREKYGWSV